LTNRWHQGETSPGHCGGAHAGTWPEAGESVICVAGRRLFRRHPLTVTTRDDRLILLIPMTYL
jgi:hypothetical protein